MTPVANSSSSSQVIGDVRISPALRGLFGCCTDADVNIFAGRSQNKATRARCSSTLTEEQANAAFASMDSKMPVAAVWSLPGAGKSVVIGYLLAEWLEAKKEEDAERLAGTRTEEDRLPLAVAATG